jgi:hypothetical protein
LICPTINGCADEFVIKKVKAMLKSAITFLINSNLFIKKILV